jgi:hypothetical protein
MPTVFKEKKRWMRENCKSRRFQMAQRRQICDCENNIAFTIKISIDWKNKTFHQ